MKVQRPEKCERKLGGYKLERKKKKTKNKKYKFEGKKNNVPTLNGIKIARYKTRGKEKKGDT